MTSLCEKTGHLIRKTRTDRGSGDQYAHCQLCGCAVVKGSWNTPWMQPKAEDDLNNVLWKANYRYDTKEKNDPLFTPLGQLWPLEVKREWVGLTDEILLDISKDAWGRNKLHISRSDHTGFYLDFGRAVEAKLKEKNGG